MVIFFTVLWLLGTHALALASQSPAAVPGGDTPPPSTTANQPEALSFHATLDSIKINARAAQVITRQFTLTLGLTQPATYFKARVEDWWRSEDGRQSFYDAPGTLERSCGKWVSLNPVEARVEPGQTLVIRLTVTLPSELHGGGFWCALTIDEVPDPLRSTEGIAVRFIASVSTGIFVNVDPVDRRASIVDITVGSRDTVVQVRNEGNTPLGIEGRVEFFATGAEIPMATTPIARSTVLTEPSRNAVVTTMLPSAADLPSGRYRVRAVLDFGADHYIGAEREVDLVREVLAGDPLP